MVIMALDHTRDYFHITAMTANPLDPATAGGALFFTRWITHFCAPAFVFLSGLSVYISAQRKTIHEASTFLFKRGVWLIIAEVVIVTLGLTFNPFYNFIILEVIWAIGCSMILLSLFIRSSYKLILITGLILVFCHNLFDFIDLPATGTVSVLIKVLFTASGTIIPLAPKHLVGVFYAVLPWTGIMFLGYAAGAWFRNGFDPKQRKRNLLISGFSLLMLFVILRIINVYGDPSPKTVYGELMPNILSFLNTSKYPPSLDFFCMTIGPSLIFLSLIEKTTNRVSRFFSNYGSVPFFYFLVHFYLLHFLLIIAFFATGHNVTQISSFPMPFFFRPVQFGFSLPVVYLIWITLVITLYRPCLWYKNYKNTHSYWWLKYI